MRPSESTACMDGLDDIEHSKHSKQSGESGQSGHSCESGASNEVSIVNGRRDNSCDEEMSSVWSTFDKVVGEVRSTVEKRLREQSVKFAQTERERDLAIGDATAAKSEIQVSNGELRNTVYDLRQKTDECDRLRSDVERLEAENAEFKKVSRVVAIENENARLVDENARIRRLGEKFKAQAKALKQQLHQLQTADRNVTDK